jgi:hypothetical protein
MAHGANPDMGHIAAPDLADPAAATTATTTTTTTTGTQPTTSSGAETTSKIPNGSACHKDADCASGVCGLGNQGTLVCVSGEISDGSIGCSMGGHDDRMTLAFLVTMALLLSRSLTRRRRR